jgi:hypothetical protein
MIKMLLSSSWQISSSGTVLRLAVLVDSQPLRMVQKRLTRFACHASITCYTMNKRRLQIQLLIRQWLLTPGIFDTPIV